MKAAKAKSALSNAPEAGIGGFRREKEEKGAPRRPFFSVRVKLDA